MPNNKNTAIYAKKKPKNNLTEVNSGGIVSSFFELICFRSLSR